MMLPVNLLFMASLEELDLMDFFSAIPAVAFLVYVLDRLGFAFTWGQALAYLDAHGERDRVPLLRGAHHRGHLLLDRPVLRALDGSLTT